MSNRFPDTEILDNYDYRMWHKSEGIIFYQDASDDSFTTICWFLHLLIDYDRAKGIEYEAQGLQVALKGTEDWFEFQLDNGETIKDQMGLGCYENL